MQGMYSATTHRLLLGVLSALLLLHSAHCLSAGEQCGGAGATGECAEGLACVAVSMDSQIAFCEALDECEVFGCNVESDKCVCHTETNCLASFSFASQDECQSSLKDANRQPCDLVTCPDVWCNDNLWHIPEGQCCPVCPPLPVAIFPSAISNPTGCSEAGVHYSEGETWRRDPCVTCTCEAGLSLCSSVSCLPLACANPIQLPDHCCPMCPPRAMPPSMVFFQPAPASSVCREGDMIYKDGESWVPVKTNPCKRGYCDEGEIFYLYRQCSAPECENPIYSEDTCCPRCPGEEEPEPIRNVSQTVFSPSSPNDDITPRSVAEDAIDEVESKNHEGMMVGHLVDFSMTSAHIAGGKRSVRSADTASSTDSGSSSPSNSRHSSTSTAIAVSASVFGVVASAIGIALLTTYIRRKPTAPKTINV